MAGAPRVCGKLHRINQAKASLSARFAKRLPYARLQRMVESLDVARRRLVGRQQADLSAELATVGLGQAARASAGIDVGPSPGRGPKRVPESRERGQGGWFRARRSAKIESMTDTPAKPRRRWFRLAFSLRTLLVVVTLIGCWLGYQLNWIRQRHALLKSNTVRLRHDYFLFDAPPAPGLLWIFGEQGTGDLYRPPGADAETVDFIYRTMFKISPPRAAYRIAPSTNQEGISRGKSKAVRRGVLKRGRTRYSFGGRPELSLI